MAKFRKDKNLWMEFFNFLIKHKCTNLLNREIGVCLANNPNDLDFWRIAAYNEYENNLNVFVARGIFQKCLRMNKTNIEAYLEYFNFELKFVEKILERRNLLCKSEEQLTIINEVDENNKGKEGGNTDNTSDEVLNLKICEIIWNKALQAISTENKIDISLKFLRLLYQNKGKLGNNTKQLKNKILAALLEDKNEINKFNTDMAERNKISCFNAERFANYSDVFLLIEIFVVKLEKLYYTSQTGSEIDRKKVIMPAFFSLINSRGHSNFENSQVSI